MAFIRIKKDPTNPALQRWMARIKIDRQFVEVSLRLKAPDSKRLAQKRADLLQVEVESGTLSAATREWLGAASSARLDQLAHPSPTAPPCPTAPGSWEEACLAYLDACRTKDHVEPIPGTARTVARTATMRRTTLLALARWFQANAVPFTPDSFTFGLVRYIQVRSTDGLNSATLWGQYSYIAPWEKWMAHRGMVDPPDRPRILEVLPRKVAPRVVLPSLASDLESLRRWRDDPIRLALADPDLDALTPGGRYHFISKQRWAVWSLILCTRGLGCRPSEASALLWDSVDLGRGIVTLLSTKTRIARKIPILYQWTLDGLAQLRRAFPSRSVVCASAMDEAFTSDNVMSLSARRTAKAMGVPAYRFKLAQKIYIAQLIESGFPPHVVAKWTGHTLTTQEKHYCEDNSYLPTTDPARYEEFGTLTDWGRKVKDHLNSVPRDLL